MWIRHLFLYAGWWRTNKGQSSSSNSNYSRVTSSYWSPYDIVSFFFRSSQHLWKCTLLTGSLTVELHYNNTVNIAGLNESECMAQCCYSENTNRVEQTGCERQMKKENRKRGREGWWNNNKVRGGRWGDRLKEKAHCEWMGLWIEENYR